MLCSRLSHMIIHAFVTIAVILFVQMPTGSYASSDEGYLNCGISMPCANLGEVGYPFWGSSRPSYCGHPAFGLNCSGGVAEITIMSVTYSVLQINCNARTLRLAFPDDRKDPCPTVLVNSSLDSSLFGYATSTTPIVLYYDCQTSDNLSGGIYPFHCDSSQTNGSNYYAVQSYQHTVPIGCKDIVFIYARDFYLAKNLTEVLNLGFELQWEANDGLCNDCRASGGQCGYKSTFTCYCEDGRSYPFTCRSEDDLHYLNCTNFLCGDQLYDIGFPFWGGNQPEYCGLPDFHLSCGDHKAEIKILSQKYEVQEINHTTHTLRVALRHYGEAYLCPKFPPHNFTFIDSSFLNCAWHNQQLTFFYNCRSPNASLRINSSYNCETSSATDGFNFFVLNGDRHDRALGDLSSTCSGSAVVLVSKSADGEFSYYAEQSGLKWSTLNNVLQYYGFWLEWKLPKNESRRCDDCQRSGGRCGYNTTSSEFSCYCKDGPYPVTCAESSSKHNRENSIAAGSSLKRNLAIGISAALSGIIIMMILIIYSYKREYISRKLACLKKDKNNGLNMKEFIRKYGPFVPKQYTYSNVKKMTNSFAEKIGKGGYGSVYKGKLPDGTLVAVKVLKESKGNGEEFFNEVASIGRTSHVNIVALFGFCCERNKRALIYEYMPNGSLDKFIFNQESESKSPRLGWKVMYEIARGIAEGLEYLHRGCATRILHFDIKPHNILLDKDFCPKISDFGLAKLCKREDNSVSMLGARGTIGYVAPEVYWRNLGGVSFKSDVYSYGMMVLEMVGGRRNIDAGVSRTSKIYFPDWMHSHLSDFVENLEIDEEMTKEEEEMVRKMILVSFWCIQTIPSSRPSMTKVVEMLKGSLQSLQIPPKHSLSFPTE